MCRLRTVRTYPIVTMPEPLERLRPLALTSRSGCGRLTDQVAAATRTYGTGPVPECDPTSNLNPNANLNPIHQQLSDAHNMIGNVADGDLVVAGIGGPSGMGKTRLAERTLTERGFKALDDDDTTPTDRSYVVFRGTMAALVQTAWLMRGGGVIVLDDADGLFLQGGLDNMNMLKQLLLNQPTRQISHHTMKAQAKQAVGPGQQQTVAPPRFATQVRFVVCSNEDFDNASARMRPHVEALRSRGLQLVRLSTDPRHNLEYVLDLIVDHDLLLSPQTPRVGVQGAQEIADWLRDRGYYLKPGVSVRTAIEAAKMRRLYPNDWRRYMERDVRDTPVLPATEIPPRRVLVPPAQRPGYERPVASLNTELRRAKRIAANAPDAASKKNAQMVFRALTLTADRLPD